MCIFENLNKSSEGRYQTLPSTETESIVQVLKELSKDQFYRKVSKNEDRLIYYHNSCRKIAIYTLKKKKT